MVQEAVANELAALPPPAQVLDPANEEAWFLVPLDGAEAILVPRDSVLQIEWLTAILASAGVDGPQTTWEIST